MARNLDSVAERESAQAGDNEGLGHTPAYFLTFTTAVYQWEGLNHLIRAYMKRDAPWPVPIGDGPDEDMSQEAAQQCRMREAIGHPTNIEWYCALKLEMMAHMSRRVLDSVHPNAGDDKDDYWATFE